MWVITVIVFCAEVAVIALFCASLSVIYQNLSFFIGRVKQISKYWLFCIALCCFLSIVGAMWGILSNIEVSFWVWLGSFSLMLLYTFIYLPIYWLRTQNSERASIIIRLFFLTPAIFNLILPFFLIDEHIRRTATQLSS